MRLQVGGGRPSNPPAENAPKAKRVYHMQRIRRARLNLKQMNQLENAYIKNPNWSKKDISQIAQQMSMRRVKVYKWHWDRKKKEELE